MKVVAYEIIKLGARVSLLFACLISGAIALVILTPYGIQLLGPNATAVQLFWAGKWSYFVFMAIGITVFYSIMFGFDNKPKGIDSVEPEKFVGQITKR